MSASFDALAVVTASTKRNPAIASGVRGAPVTHIASLQCLPLASVSAAIAARAGINTPHESKSTMVDGALDIKEGDVLVIASTEYEIQDVEEYPWWPWDSGAFRRLIVLEIKSL